PASVATATEPPAGAGALAAITAPPPAALNPYILELARAAPVTTAAATTNAFGLPQLDPLLALGSLSAVVAALDRWQLLDPGMIAATDAAAPAGAAGTEATVVPFNRIPLIRAAVADR